MDPRPTGVVIGVIGAVVLAVSALADPLGIGEGHTFGWLQILGVVLGGVILLLGFAIALQWLPPRRSTVATNGSQNTTIVEEKTTPSQAP